MESASSLVRSTVQSFILTGTETDLVRDFLLFFARFEYAMKRTKFLKGDETRAGADWDKLAVHLREAFDNSASIQFAEALEYLSTYPPQKQIVTNDKLDWAIPKKDKSESNSKYILRLVRTVRNNLFHGGKFPEPIGAIAESTRDQALLKHSLTVLAQCVEMEPQLKLWFQLDV